MVKISMQIFLEVGVNVNILCREQPERYLSPWIKIHDKYGSNGLLQENRGLCSSWSLK